MLPLPQPHILDVECRDAHVAIRSGAEKFVPIRRHFALSPSLTPANPGLAIAANR